MMDADLGHIKKKIEESRDFLDKLTGKVPGFKGYVEKAERYDADKIVRNFLADEISSYKKIVDSAMAESLKNDKQDLLPELNSLNTILERILKKCQYADYGSTASFARVKITEDLQEKLLLYDWNLISILEECTPDVEKLTATDVSDPAAQIKNVKTKITDFEKSFEDRKKVIMEVI